MPVSFQLVIDCAAPERLAAFWAEALHYVAQPPPPGFDTWDDFYRSIGVSEDELGQGPDRIEDPNGEGPSIWFQVVPERKTIKNRIHLDIDAGGGRALPLATRRARVEAEARRLVALGATRSSTLSEEGLDHYAVALTDPEGNEFDIF
ncbi:VOC family protein [Nocardioides pacificus]